MLPVVGLSPRVLNPRVADFSLMWVAYGWPTNRKLTKHRQAKRRQEGPSPQSVVLWEADDFRWTQPMVSRARAAARLLSVAPGIPLP
jgi:hypothetical protein